MKKFTREELAQSAISFFEKNTEANTIIACEDGQLFLDNAKSRGALAGHCAELDLKTFTIERAESLALKGKVIVVDYSKMNKDELMAEAMKQVMAGCAEMDEEELRTGLEKGAKALAAKNKPAEEATAPPVVDYTKMTKVQLLEEAAKKGISVPDDALKLDIVALLGGPAV